MLQKIIQDWGDDYTNNLKVYIDGPTIDLDLRTRSYQWAKLNKKMIVSEKGEQNLFRVPADDALVVDEEIKHLTDWRSYSDFHKHYFSEWEVIMPISNDWKLGT